MSWIYSLGQWEGGSVMECTGAVVTCNGQSTSRFRELSLGHVEEQSSALKHQDIFSDPLRGFLTQNQVSMPEYT